MAGFFQKEEPEVLNSYGYTFRLTKHHMTPAQLDPLKHKYDVVGSEASEILDAMYPPPPPRAGWYNQNSKKTNNNGGSGDTNSAPTGRDTYALLRDNAAADPKLQRLWDEVNAVPEWVDWEQIRRGQDVFYRYVPAAVAGFAFQGLLATTGASFRPAETLVRTGGHSARVAKNRLFETFQLILQVTRSLDAVRPGGEGFASAVRVRLLHAEVRGRILQLRAQRPAYFDTQEFGVPINELDSMQSVCAFSTNLVWLALPRQGIYVRRQEALDYLALWRWVCYVLGTPYYVLETPERALATMESLMYACLAPSKNSQVLAQNLVTALEGVAPIYEPKEFFEAGTRYINGDQLCDEVGLGKASLYWNVVIRGIVWALMATSYTTRAVPAADRWMLQTFRTLFWEYIVEHKDGLRGGWKYDFKYVPQLDGAQTVTSSGVEKPAPRRARGIWTPPPPLELLGLASFGLTVVVAAALVGLVGGAAFKACSSHLAWSALEW